MDPFALEQLRPTAHYWRYRIGQFLIPLIVGGALTYFVYRGVVLFGILFGFLTILGTFQEIYRLWQTRTFAITFYPNYFTIQEGRTLKTFSYAEVAVVSRQPNPTGRPDSETIIFTSPEGQHEIVIDPYNSISAHLPLRPMSPISPIIPPKTSSFDGINAKK